MELAPTKDLDSINMCPYISTPASSVDPQSTTPSACGTHGSTHAGSPPEQHEAQINQKLMQSRKTDIELPSRELTYPPDKAYLKMIFLFPRWDMLVSWRVSVSCDDFPSLTRFFGDKRTTTTAKYYLILNTTCFCFMSCWFVCSFCCVGCFHFFSSWCY